MITLLLAVCQTVDESALREYLSKKGRSRVEFDLAYLDTLPNYMVAANLQSKYKNGKLPIYLDVLQDPLTLPERMQDLAVRCEKSLPDLLECAVVTLGGKRAEVAPEKSVAVTGYPDPVALAIGAIRAAIATRDAWTICRVVLEVRGDLVHTGLYRDDELTIDFDGDDRHAFDVVEGKIRVFLDMAGNDRYEGNVAATRGGFALVFDFAGDDAYVATTDLAQAAAQKGVAVLYDAAGNDTYSATQYAQGYARDGVAALVDRAGNDRYEMDYTGQAAAEQGGFAVLIDADGHDSYLGRDPWYGHDVRVLSEQDYAHNMNKVQGVSWGHNARGHRAGGVAILYDLRGDDTYRAGTWAQGTGYFMGLAALIDLEGDDEYQSWVYSMGSGAHGGFGLLVDRKGDDLYQVGGWNAPAIAVDFGIGIFLEGEGNDRYITASNGFGRSVGLGIAVFQDSAGDDDYSTTKDRQFGVGTSYGADDYNRDGRVTPEENLHWAIFLDLGGADRYPGASAGKKTAPSTDPALADFRRRVKAAKLEELFSLKLPDGAIRHEARRIVWDAFEERKASGIERIQKWTATLKPLVEKRKALDEARAKDPKQLRKLWAARKQSPIKVDPALREIARGLDRVSPSWREAIPLSWNLNETSLTLENFSLNAGDRSLLDQNRAIQRTNGERKILQDLNDLRSMYGRRAVQSYDLLFAAIEDASGTPEERAKKQGFWGPVVEFTVKGPIESADLEVLLDPRWMQVAAVEIAKGEWKILIGQRQ